MNLDQAKTVLHEFLSSAGFAEVPLEITPVADGEFRINLSPSPADSPLLIGKNGESLISIQHLMKIIFRIHEITTENDRVRLDIDSYRQNQEKRVLDIAERRAKLVMDTGRQEILPPMSAFFRRSVHLFIKEKYPQLMTFSQGDGSYRSVCIASSQVVPEESPTDLYMDMSM